MEVSRDRATARPVQYSLSWSAPRAPPPPLHILPPGLCSVSVARRLASCGFSCPAACSRLPTLSRLPNGLDTRNKTLHADMPRATVPIPHTSTDINSGPRAYPVSPAPYHLSDGSPAVAAYFGAELFLVQLLFFIYGFTPTRAPGRHATDGRDAGPMRTYTSLITASRLFAAHEVVKCAAGVPPAAADANLLRPRHSRAPRLVSRAPLPPCVRRRRSPAAHVHAHVGPRPANRARGVRQRPPGVDTCTC